MQLQEVAIPLLPHHRSATDLLLSCGRNKKGLDIVHASVRVRQASLVHPGLMTLAGYSTLPHQDPSWEFLEHVASWLFRRVKNQRNQRATLDEILEKPSQRWVTGINMCQATTCPSLAPPERAQVVRPVQGHSMTIRLYGMAPPERARPGTERNSMI